jgi:hypothetical protein
MGIDVSKDTVTLFSLSDSLHMDIGNNEESLTKEFGKFQNKSETLVAIENGGYDVHFCVTESWF